MTPTLIIAGILIVGLLIARALVRRSGDDLDREK